MIHVPVRYKVVLLGEYADNEIAMQMFQSREFRNVTACADVKDPPEGTILNEVVNRPA